MSRSISKYHFLSFVFLITFLIGCDQYQSSDEEGVGEKVGKSIDHAVEKSEEKLVDAKDAVVEKTEETIEYVEDSVITSKIKAKILSDPLLKVFEIGVETTNGKVTLTGLVETELSIGRTLEIVNSVNGVQSIEMNIRIKKKQ